MSVLARLKKFFAMENFLIAQNILDEAVEMWGHDAREQARLIRVGVKTWRKARRQGILT